ncbi:MAG: hypothetical protein M1833_003374 [Piccolia ochrophora]|nr:MAG: hypothetical protein M1833_003374 [Piccolia ochrophora]
MRKFFSRSRDRAGRRDRRDIHATPYESTVSAGAPEVGTTPIPGNVDDPRRRSELVSQEVPRGRALNPQRQSLRDEPGTWSTTSSRTNSRPTSVNRGARLRKVAPSKDNSISSQGHAQPTQEPNALTKDGNYQPTDSSRSSRVVGSTVNRMSQQPKHHVDLLAVTQRDLPSEGAANRSNASSVSLHSEEVADRNMQGHRPSDTPVVSPAIGPNELNSPDYSYMSAVYSANPSNTSRAPERHPIALSEAKHRPGVTSQRPDDGTYRPDDEVYHPDDGIYHPGDTTYGSGDGTYRPDDGAYHPDDGTYHPSDTTYRPSNGTYRPAEQGNHVQGRKITPKIGGDGRAVGDQGPRWYSPQSHGATPSSDLADLASSSRRSSLIRKQVGSGPSMADRTGTERAAPRMTSTSAHRIRHPAGPNQDATRSQRGEESERTSSLYSDRPDSATYVVGATEEEDDTGDTSTYSTNPYSSSPLDPRVDASSYPARESSRNSPSISNGGPDLSHYGDDGGDKQGYGNFRGGSHIARHDKHTPNRTEPMPTPTRAPAERRRGLNTQVDSPKFLVEGSSQKPSLEGVVDLTNTVDTEIRETQAPAVVHETVLHDVHHIREEVIQREIHTHDIIHRVQPIIDVQVLPPRHFVPVAGGGLKEVSADAIPGRIGHWGVVETVTQDPALDKRRLPHHRTEVEMESSQTYQTKEGYPRTETVWRYPPTLETGARDTGQSWPLVVDPERYHQAPHGRSESPDEAPSKMKKRRSSPHPKKREALDMRSMARDLPPS